MPRIALQELCLLQRVSRSAITERGSLTKKTQTRIGQWLQCPIIEGVMIGVFLCWVGEESLLERVFMCMCACMFVQYFFDSGEKTAGPTGTGELTFDAPERREDDGPRGRAIGPPSPSHVPLRDSIMYLYRQDYWTHAKQTRCVNSNYGWVRDFVLIDTGGEGSAWDRRKTFFGTESSEFDDF